MKSQTQLQILGICLVVAAILIWQGNGSPSAPEPTVYNPYVAPTSRPVDVEPTSRPAEVQPTTRPAQVIPTDVPTSTPVPTCPNAKYPTRLRKDADARVCTKNERLIVRKSPRLNGAEVLSLYPGTTIRILAGPVCADNFWWWKVEIYPGTPYGLQGYSYSKTWTTNQSCTGWAREGWDEVDADFICQ